MDKKKLLNIGIFALIAIAAVWLRLLYLHTDLWYDEACSWVSAKQMFPFGIMDNLMNVDLQHTPLYFFLLHFWMRMFGDGEVSLRILSLIFGLGSIPLVYTAAKKVTSSKEALFAAAITAVCPILVLFSVEVRMYPVVVFLVLLSLNYLIDFEKKEDWKSLAKLIIINLLIPYTLVGGILYNISVFGCYTVYLYNEKKEAFKKYITAAVVEFVCLIPYFSLLIYYAKMRSTFVITHEGPLAFFHLVDVIRNFFGATIIDNIYWPSLDPYGITFLFALLVVVPCVYFIYGFIKNYKNQDKFINVLNNIFLLSFCLSVIFALFKVNVFTSRYILYLLPPLFILSISGLFRTLQDKHCKIFLGLFIAVSFAFSYYHAASFKIMKTLSFKTVRIESDKLNLGIDDVVILPFGADAPYYFRDLDSPRVFDFDFHKEVRNPYNRHYYSEKQQQDIISRPGLTIYDSVMSNSVFSPNFLEYFIQNVNTTIPSGRYVLVAMYGSDVNFITDISSLRKSLSGEYDVPPRKLEIMFKKFLCDVSLLLNVDFYPVKTFRKDNYTFFLYKKR